MSKTENKKVSALKALLETEGWQVIREELDQDLKITEAKLFGEVKMNEGETHETLQRERIDRIELRNLPENLIKELTEEPSEEPNLEAYD